MDMKQYEKGAVEAKTAPTAAMTAGYPTNGDPATGNPATVPGAYWYYQIQAELNHIITEANLIPNHNRLTQLAEAVRAMIDNKVAGIDADLLDGQHGSYYQDAANLNAGTVPTARLNGTYADAIVAGNIGRKAAVHNVKLINDQAWRDLPVGWAGVVDKTSVRLPSNHDHCFVKQSRFGANGNGWTGLLTRLDNVYIYFGRAPEDKGARWVSILTHYDSIKTGTVINFAASSAPQGFLECNGANLLRATFGGLFSTIGTTFNKSTDTDVTKFRLPDLRGEFVRGWDHGRNIDKNRALGTHQSDAYKSHTHKYFSPHESLGGGTQNSSYYYNYGSNTSSSYTGKGANTGASGGTETRPRNIALMYIIKF